VLGKGHPRFPSASPFVRVGPVGKLENYALTYPGAYTDHLL
jgi:hypothetical protein